MLHSCCAYLLLLITILYILWNFPCGQPHHLRMKTLIPSFYFFECLFSCLKVQAKKPQEGCWIVGGFINKTGHHFNQDNSLLFHREIREEVDWKCIVIHTPVNLRVHNWSEKNFLEQWHSYLLNAVKSKRSLNMTK